MTPPLPPLYDKIYFIKKEMCKIWLDNNAKFRRVLSYKKLYWKHGATDSCAIESGSAISCPFWNESVTFKVKVIFLNGIPNDSVIDSAARNSLGLISVV